MEQRQRFLRHNGVARGQPIQTVPAIADPDYPGRDIRGDMRRGSEITALVIDPDRVAIVQLPRRRIRRGNPQSVAAIRITG